MQESDVQQWVQLIEGKTPMTWELWASHFDNMASLTPLGRQYAHEAVRTLSNFFGETYLERCRVNDHPLFSMAYPAFNDTPVIVENKVVYSKPLFSGHFIHYENQHSKLNLYTERTVQFESVQTKK